ncbi:MAG: ion channel [Desulfurivibrionaceae bacterium]
MRRLLFIGILFLAILGLGVFGYIFIDGAGFLDALYMTVITITTVGYSETFPLSTGGKLFTVFLILIGVASKREHDEMIFNPSPATVINSSDILVMLGGQDNIRALERQL